MVQAEPFSEDDPDLRAPVRFSFAGRTRIVILIVTTMTLSFVMANSLALNFTVICMGANGSKPVLDPETGEYENLMFSLSERSWLFSAIAVGNFLGTLPFIHWANSRGTREAFAAFALVSTIATAFTPLAADLGFWLVFTCRLLQGVSIGAAWPMMGAVTSEWSTLRLSGTYVALLSCHLQMGSVLTMPLSGWLCESAWGWPAVYYTQAVVTLLLMVLFYSFYRDSPALHSNVSEKELHSIQKNKEQINFAQKNRPPTPYKAIFLDPAAWACVVCSFSGNLGFQFLSQYGPIYLKEILHFDVRTTGFGTALPYVLAIVVKIVAGPLSDWMPYIGVKARVVLFASISQFTMAAAYIALAFMTPHTQGLAQVVFTTAVVFGGLNCVGNVKSIQLISGSFVYVLMAVNSLSSSFWVLVLPPIVGVMAPDNSQEEWYVMYLVFGGYVVLSTVFFVFTAQATPRQWAKAGPHPGQIQPAHPDSVKSPDLNINNNQGNNHA